MLDVSIIIPAYCTTPQSVVWLEECICSALEQDCQVVVYDDASPLAAEVAGVLKRYPIHWDVGVANVGVSQARNIAAYMATNSLLLPLDSDDTFKPGAVERLLTCWDGAAPVYCDVAKFGAEIEPHYALLDFSCENLYRYVGLASVNVLHLRSQWAILGGWDASIDFYEDGEYNARLFAKYCARRCPEPLVNYRMHSTQRTKTYAAQAAMRAKLILSKIRRLDMACSSCGGARRKAAVPVAVPATNPANLPGSQDGRVLAHYIGGVGRARHYYQGTVTKFPYRVTYDDYIYADPRDVGLGTLLEPVAQAQVQQEPVAPAVTEPTAVVSVAPVDASAASLRQAVTSVARKPVN